jgi:hypothetical protein
MLPSVRPLMQQRLRAVWEFADRIHITHSVLKAQWEALAFRFRLADCIFGPVSRTVGRPLHQRIARSFPVAALEIIDQARAAYLLCACMIDAARNA